MSVVAGVRNGQLFMINLHETLSEFSYGYGVTREVERLLLARGINTTPYFPNLVQEGTAGFDVAFNAPGVVLMLQFKLGQSLTRFVSSPVGTQKPTPPLGKPFWRFFVDTAEPNGQFQILHAAESRAEVFYVAPRLIDWSTYVSAFSANEVLDRSIAVRPSEIANALISSNAAQGRHRVCYDQARGYVCSTPVPIKLATAASIAETVVERVSTVEKPLRDFVYPLYREVSEQRIAADSRPARTAREHELRRTLQLFHTADPSTGSISRFNPRLDREIRLDLLRSRLNSEDRAIAAALSVEAGALGTQILFATRPT